MQSLASFISMNVGAGDEKRAEKAAVTGVWICEIVGVAVFFLVLRHGDLFSAVFTADSAVIARALRICRALRRSPVNPRALAFIGYYTDTRRRFDPWCRDCCRSFWFVCPSLSL